MPRPKKRTFNDCLAEIDIEIAKRAVKWTLSSISWLSFEDVAQIIRIHLHKKFSKWDQNRPLLPWVNTVISNQIRNIVRSIYGNYSRPCLTCAANEGNNLCSIYGIQCNSCPLYAKWEKTRKRAHDTKLTVPLENHQQEVYDILSDGFEVEKAALQLHDRMEKVLKPIEWKVYKYLYIKHGEEEGLVKVLGFKTSEKGRMAGYRQINNLKKAIMEKVEKLLADGEIDLI